MRGTTREAPPLAEGAIGAEAAHAEAATPRCARTPASAPAADVWAERVRPAVAWLYGFVDLALTAPDAGGGGAPSGLLWEEHCHAFAEVGGEVARMLSESGDGLALCLWRALVALLAHYSERAVALVNRVGQLQRAHLHAQSLHERAQAQAQAQAAPPSAAHASEAAAWARTQQKLELQIEELQREAAERAAPAPTVAARTNGGANGGEGGGVGGGNLRLGLGNALEAELELARRDVREARQATATANAQLSMERGRYGMLERSFARQRNQLSEALASLAEARGAHDGGGEATSATSGVGGDSQLERLGSVGAGISARLSARGVGGAGARRARGSSGGSPGERGMGPGERDLSPERSPEETAGVRAAECRSLQREVATLETALREERLRRHDLEALRGAFVERFTAPFVANLEKELAMRELGLSVKDAAALAPSTAAREARDALLRARPAL